MAAGRCSIYTLGCRLNQADAGLMADDLVRAGYSIVPWGKDADLLIINSCTVTGTAGQKTRQAVRAARRRCPGAFVVLAGCAANVDRKLWLKEASVDLVLPNEVKNRITQYLPDRVDHADAARLPGSGGLPDGGNGKGFVEEGCGLYIDRTRANLKIQEGCAFNCSYCIVPKARGRPRSRCWDDVLRETHELLERGHREIVLTGVNIATYRDEGRDLADLVEALLQVGGDWRLRLSSTEPGPVVSRVIDLMAGEPRICRFLHLPMQYAEDSILRRMRRRYSVAEYSEIVTRAAALVPGICLGTDLMVGFPGETDDVFTTCCSNAEALPLSYFHVFSYSRRPGTAAAEMPDQINGSVAASRHTTLSAIGNSKSMAFSEGQVGEKVQVLTEGSSRDGELEGWSDNYLRVAFSSPDSSALNEFVTVEVDTVRGPRAVSGRRR